MAKKYTGRSAAAARASGINVDRPDIQARKAAAASMKQAGVQSLSGLSGSQGQVARFKTEQNQLRNEYNDKNTSDERKEEIVKDLRGVSRDLNNQSRAAALNQVIREFGPGSVLPGGGIMGSDAGARFQQLRGNPNFYQDGRPGLETFVGNQGAFKTGDKNLFKQVHPNPLKILLGAATQAGNISPLGLVRNINKIRKGEPLIDLSFMERNTSESPSRLKNFYNAYMDSVNKKIQAENNKKFDETPIDPQFKKFLPNQNQIGTEDMTLDAAMLLPDDQTDRFGIPAGAEPGETDMIGDEEFNTLLNQYSLLNQNDLATSLLDDSEIEKELTPEQQMTQEEYDEELRNKLPFLYDESNVVPEILPVTDMFPEGGVSGSPVTQAGQELVFTDGAPVTKTVDTAINTPSERAAYDILNSNAINDVRSPDYNQSMLYQNLISGPNPTVDLMMQNPNLSYSDINDLAGGLSGGAYSGTPDFGYFADGGSASTYDVLKLINDTMNDG